MEDISYTEMELEDSLDNLRRELMEEFTYEKNQIVDSYEKLVKQKNEQLVIQAKNFDSLRQELEAERTKKEIYRTALQEALTDVRVIEKVVCHDDY